MTKNDFSRKRDSSIELFRIIAAFAVLIVHFNGWFVGGLPNKLDFGVLNWRWAQFFIAASTCICVNLFLIISGYFGLRLKISSVVHILLLLLGIYLPLYLVSVFCLHESFSTQKLISQFFVVSKSGYFVQCYLLLMFFSPVLNAFVNNNSRKTILCWGLLFWIIELWFGCIVEEINKRDVMDFHNGYSLIHFILVYILARIVCLYKKEIIQIRILYWITGYVVCTIILFLMYGIGLRWGYANPINIISSFCLFFPFLRFSFHNIKINSIAKSTFAVYLIQVADPVKSFLERLDYYLLCNCQYVLYLAAALLVIVAFFFCCIIYDKSLNRLIMPIEQRLRKQIGGKLYSTSLFCE